LQDDSRGRMKPGDSTMLEGRSMLVLRRTSP
jgi:hypothetical protein